MYRIVYYSSISILYTHAHYSINHRFDVIVMYDLDSNVIALKIDLSMSMMNDDTSYMKLYYMYLI